MLSISIHSSGSVSVSFFILILYCISCGCRKFFLQVLAISYINFLWLQLILFQVFPIFIHDSSFAHVVFPSTSRLANPGLFLSSGGRVSIHFLNILNFFFLLSYILFYQAVSSLSFSFKNLCIVYNLLQYLLLKPWCGSVPLLFVWWSRGLPSLILNWSLFTKSLSFRFPFSLTFVVLVLSLAGASLWSGSRDWRYASLTPGSSSCSSSVLIIPLSHTHTHQTSQVAHQTHGKLQQQTAW